MTQFGHHAQNDRWIAEAVFPDVRDGFFVEAGACAGESGSATLALERDLGWDGICVEPLSFYYRKLIRYRHCKTDNRCLSARSGDEVPFLSYIEDRARSGIEALNKNGHWASRREVHTEVSVVETVTLGDLLDEHHAPDTVHYLCLDVEGAERTILDAFDLARRRILAISIEGPSCDDLLVRYGYRRVANSFAPGEIDHYFLHPAVV